MFPITMGAFDKMEMLPEPMAAESHLRTYGGNKAFHNFGTLPPLPSLPI